MIQSVLLFVVFLAVTSSFSVTRFSSNRLSTAVSLFGNEPPKSNTPAPKKDGGGLFGGMGNMMEQMKKAQEIAKKAEILNKELAETSVVGSDPSGQVFCTFNGLSMPIGIKISESILGQGSEAVSLAATQAMVDAHKKATEGMMAKMQAMYSGQSI